MKLRSGTEYYLPKPSPKKVVFVMRKLCTTSGCWNIATDQEKGGACKLCYKDSWTCTTDGCWNRVDEEGLVFCRECFNKGNKEWWTVNDLLAEPCF